LSRVKFGIRAWLLIVLTIKRSNKKKKQKKTKKNKKNPTVLIRRSYCSLFKITVHRLHHQTGRRYPQHPSQPTSVRVYSSKGSASASVVLNTDHSHRSQAHAELLPSTTRSAAATVALCRRFQRC
jgi:hypothetical protein